MLAIKNKKEKLVRKEKKLIIKVDVTFGADGIKADPDPVQVKKGTRPDIKWHIKTPGWKFPANGIAIDDNANVFINPGREKEYKVFRWTDLNPERQRYTYRINLTNGKTYASRDPGIGNGGR